MARYEYKELSENMVARWTSKDDPSPFTIIDSTNQLPPIEIKLTSAEAKELALFLVQHLYEYI